MKVLGRGSSFALIAPSSFISPDSVQRGSKILEDFGYKTIAHPKLFNNFDGYGGSIAERTEALHWAFAQSGADAVLCVRGGYGAIQLLEHIDYGLVGQNPKPFIGYSDITSLHMAFIAQCGFKSIHGPMLGPDIAGKPPQSTSLLLDFLQNKTQNLAPSFQTLHHGAAEGLLLGGNLAVFLSSVGTPYMPNLEGCILFLEDVGEAAYRIDRMLRTLRHGGILQKCAALAFGDFTEKGDDIAEGSVSDYQDYIKQYLKDATEGLGIPVIYGLPSGHCTPNFPLPLGARVHLDTEKQIFTLLDNFFTS